MEQLGRGADAIREVDGVIAFWKEADQDLPLLVEAKAMRARPGEGACPTPLSTMLPDAIFSFSSVMRD